MRKKYRGAFSRIASLKHGDTVRLERPLGMPRDEFRKRVGNALNHFCRTRGRKLRTRMVPVTGAIMVRRIHTENELRDIRILKMPTDKPDLIQYAIHAMPVTDPAKGPGKRLELGFKNLTDHEASALLIVLDRLQAVRAAAVALADASKRTEH